MASGQEYLSDPLSLLHARWFPEAKEAETWKQKWQCLCKLMEYSCGDEFGNAALPEKIAPNARGGEVIELFAKWLDDEKHVPTRQHILKLLIPFSNSYGKQYWHMSTANKITESLMLKQWQERKPAFQSLVTAALISVYLVSGSTLYQWQPLLLKTIDSPQTHVRKACWDFLAQICMLSNQHDSIKIRLSRDVKALIEDTCTDMLERMENTMKNDKQKDVRSSCALFIYGAKQICSGSIFRFERMYEGLNAFLSRTKDLMDAASEIFSKTKLEIPGGKAYFDDLKAKTKAKTKTKPKPKKVKKKTSDSGHGSGGFVGVWDVDQQEEEKEDKRKSNKKKQLTAAQRSSNMQAMIAQAKKKAAETDSDDVARDDEENEKRKSGKTTKASRKSNMRAMIAQAKKQHASEKQSGHATLGGVQTSDHIKKLHGAGKIGAKSSFRNKRPDDEQKEVEFNLNYLVDMIEHHLSFVEQQSGEVDEYIAGTGASSASLSNAKSTALQTEKSLMTELKTNISALSQFLNDIILIENLFNREFSEQQRKQQRTARQQYASNIEKYETRPKPKCDVASFLQLMFDAKTGKLQLQQWLTKVAAECKKQGIEIASNSGAKEKNMDRAFYKTFYVYSAECGGIKYAFRELTDVLRCSLVFKTFDDLYRCFAVIEKLSNGILRVKDRFNPKTMPFGYRDMLINMYCPGSAIKIVCEVQLHHIMFHKYKKISHRMYKKARLFEEADQNRAYLYADNKLRDAIGDKVYDVKQDDLGPDEDDEKSDHDLTLREVCNKYQQGLAKFVDKFIEAEYAEESQPFHEFIEVLPLYAEIEEFKPANKQSCVDGREELAELGIKSVPNLRKYKLLLSRLKKQWESIKLQQGDQ